VRIDLFFSAYLVVAGSISCLPAQNISGAQGSAVGANMQRMQGWLFKTSAARWIYQPIQSGSPFEGRMGYCYKGCVIHL
jgi:hypothetical protein